MATWDPAARRRWLADGAVAVGVGAAQVGAAWALSGHRGQSIDIFGYACLAAAGLVLALRRRYAVPVLLATYALSVAYWLTAAPRGLIFPADVVAFVTVVLARRRALAVAALAGYYVGYQWLPVPFGVHAAPSAAVAVGGAAGLLLLLAVGEGVRLRRQRAEAQARELAERVERRATEQRLAIARELHDLIAHNISVISIQANTALHLMDRRPERARAALSTIDEVSRQVLGEIRSVVGVLRRVDEDAPRAPGPSVERVDELAATTRAAGLDVTVERAGPTGPLPATVDAAAYRIVQEALTNAVRHSTGRHAVVRLARSPAELVVEVDDDGATAPETEAGHGIRGMRERAQALGGTLSAGPASGGGFRVRAVLPLPRPDAERAT